MSTVNVNLARKWRSRNFDQIIGQELTVRILKNSLYLNHLFPLYLFSGQHGCGKTTTARIFAAALNCEKLDFFQKEPKDHSIPCLQCLSCKAMTAGNHPDFIEIDGASHTGVDNVRHIIDIAAFLPLMGRKKIYLIDEAHMLSKAAFNAFLKILEEPPASVLFMLATTEHHKIIETVRSRSFQLFFKAVNLETLAEYLEFICIQEQIVFQKDALISIAQQSKGSIRDALNLLEQVRFESNQVSKDAVLKVLGHADEGVVLLLFECIVMGDSAKLLACIREHACESHNVETMWKVLIELINSCIWIVYDLPPKKQSSYYEQLRKIASFGSITYFSNCLQVLFEHELLCAKTGFPWYLLEMILLRMCQIPRITAKDGSLIKEEGSLQKNSEKNTQQVPSAKQDDFYALWNIFVTKVDQEDPLLGSILRQAHYDGIEHTSKTITIYFGKEFTFFNDIIEKSHAVWKPILNATMGQSVVMHVTFKELERPVSVKVSSKPHYNSKKNVEKNEALKTIDISNEEEWKRATLLKKMFAGTIQELPEGQDE